MVEIELFLIHLAGNVDNMGCLKIWYLKKMTRQALPSPPVTV